MEKYPPIPSGIDPVTFRLVAQCLNHYATSGPRLRYKEKPFNVVGQVTAVYYSVSKKKNDIGD
jgi:hypothetical protein